MTDVLVLGDANPDLILRGDVVPRFGQAEQLLSSADLVIGASAAIFAHGLSRLGRPTRLVATTGRDLFADVLNGLLVAGGVDTTALIREDGIGTGVTVVLSKDEDRGVLTFPGAIGRLTPERALSALARAVQDGARHVHVASFFLLPALAAGLSGVLEEARRQGLTTSLDTNFDPAERWDLLEDVLPHLDLLFPNRTELLASATRVGGVHVSDVEVAARLLAARGPVVVVKDGASGALRVPPSGAVVREAGTPVTPVDTTGAGDTFDAAYVDSFLRGLDPAECLRRAALAGALCTSGVGGTAAQPTLDELLTPDSPSPDPLTTRRAPDASHHP